MIIETIDSLRGLEGLRSEWFELWQRCPRATPFQSPQWLLPWTRYLFGGGAIAALAMRDRGELAGFAPLFMWGVDKLTVSFLGAGISDYGDLLFAPGAERECIHALRRYVDRCSVGDVLDLREVRCGSALLKDAVAEQCSVCPALELSSYPESMDRKHRTDVHRARNRLSKCPGTKFAMADAKSSGQMLDAFFGLYEARWGAPDDALRYFYCEAARQFLKAGNLRLSALEIGGKAAAAIYAFLHGGTLYCYLSGFDPGMSKMSPGAALLGWAVERAIEEGAKEVDFLRHPEAYKYLWGARDRINYAIRGYSAQIPVE